MARSAIVIAVFCLAGCSSHPTCVPGDQKACVCTDGSPGAQVCSDDGSRYEACTCEAPPDHDAGVSDGGADAGVDAGAPDAGANDSGVPDAGNVDAGPPPLLITVNFCLGDGGCTFRAGSDDVVLGRSSLVSQPSTLTPFSGVASTRDAVVSCLQATLAPFNIEVNAGPLDGGPRREVVIAGTPQQLGLPAGQLNVAPFACNRIDNTFLFVFGNVMPSSAADLCWSAAQVVGVSFGADHKLDNRDVMTYLANGPSMKTFVDDAGSCGESSARSCLCDFTSIGGSTTTINTFQVMLKGAGPHP